MQLTGKNLIGYATESSGTITYQTFNPISNTLNPTVFTEATEQEVFTACELAQNAFEEYANTSGNERANFLLEIHQELEANKAFLFEIYQLESGLPANRANIEFERTLHQLRTFAAAAKANYGLEATIESNDFRTDSEQTNSPDIRKMNVQLGPVAVFGSSNFPFAYSTIGGDSASALAVGCPVIVKSHPMHAGTSEAVAQCVLKAARKCGMPNGVFSNLNSSGIQVGVQLVSNSSIKAVGFTGSINGGRALYNLAAQREQPIPVFAEMGSTNPVVILPEKLAKNEEFWAETYAQSISLNAGQFCTNPGLLIALNNNSTEKFMQQLVQKVAALNADCMLHPTIHNNFNTGKIKALNQGAVVELTNLKEALKANFAKVTLAKVSATEFIKNKQLHHEVFGPFSLIILCDSVLELTQVVESLNGQLTGTLIGETYEIQSNSQLVNALQQRVGRIIFNGVPTGVAVVDAMNHGGPYPATTDARFTAVGKQSVKRWLRPVAYQNCPNELLPKALQNNNPLGIARWINGELICA